MDFDVLRGFITVSQMENLKEAARVLHVSQSALSSMMRGLEEEVGEKLFDRGGKTMQVNDGGRMLAAAARQLLQRHEEAKKAMRRAETVCGTVHIDVQNENDGLIYLLSQLHRRHPQIAFHLHNMKASLEDYLNSDMDFYVLPGDMKGDLPHLRIAGFLAIYAIVSADHPLAKRRVLRLEELRGERFVFATGDGGELEDTYRCCVQAGLKPNVTFLCDDISAQLELARHAGVVVITYNTFRQFRRNLRGVVEIPIDFSDSVNSSIVLAWPPQPANPLVEYLVADMRETYPEGVTRVL